MRWKAIAADAERSEEGRFAILPREDDHVVVYDMVMRDSAIEPDFKAARKWAEDRIAVANEGLPTIKTETT